MSQAVDKTKVRSDRFGIVMQAGSAKPGTVAYGKSYSAGQPIPMLTNLVDASGTARVSRIATASFNFKGRVGTYYLYLSKGSA